MFYFITSLSLIAAASSIYMAGLVYFRNTKAWLNRLFAILSLSIAWWAFAEFQSRTAATQEQAAFWLHLQFWPFSSVLFLHFALLFTGRRFRGRLEWLFYSALYASALLITVVDMTTDFITGDPVHDDWGWSFRYTNTISAWIAACYVGALALVALFIVYLEYRRQQDTQLRKQVRVALIGFSIPVVAGVVFSILLPLFGFYLPELTTDAFGLGGVIFIGFATWRYQLFRESPAVSIEDISTTPDSLFMLDGEGRVTGVNRALEDLLGFTEAELEEEGVEAIFVEDINLWRYLLVESSDDVKELETRLRKKDGSMVRVSISTKKTVNAEGRKETVCLASNLTARLRVADALEKSEQRYRRLVESSPDAIAVVNLKTDIIMVNQQAANFYGVETPDGMVGKNFVKILAPGEKIKALGYIARTLREDITRDEEFTFIKNDGNPFPGAVSAAVLRSASGRPTGFIASVKDLTERKQAEREIREKTADLQLINEINEAANSGRSMDEVLEQLTGSIRESFNSSTAALYLPVDGGRSLKLQKDPITAARKKKIERLIRRPISDFTTLKLEPGMRHKQLLEAGVPTSINDIDEISRLVGEFAPTEALKRFVPPIVRIMGVHASLCVPFVYMGEPIGMIVLSRETPYTQRELDRVASISEQITALLHRQDTERRLLESEELYRSLIETSPDDIAMVDLDGRLVMVNERAAEMHGYDSSQELLGKRFADLIAREDRRKAAVAQVAMSRNGIVRNLEVSILSKDGSKSPAEINASVLKDEKGRPQAMVGIVRDISERKQAEAQIARQRSVLEARNAELAALFSISSAVSTHIDLQGLLDHSLEAINRIGGRSRRDRSAVFIREEDRLRLAARAGGDGDIAPCYRNLRPGQCLCGQVAETGKLLICPNSDVDERHIYHREGEARHGHVIIPLRIKDETIGVLCLYYPPDMQLHPRDLDLLVAVGNQLAMAVENIRLYEKTKMLSLHDPLTGLGNRRLLEIRLDENFLRATRMGQPFSLVMIDLDHFKEFNDKFGHLAGDRMLKEIAGIISESIRGMDFACRFGGEEFLLVLSETYTKAAERTAERIRRKVMEHSFHPEPHQPPASITVSLGVAQYEQAVKNRDDLIARADMSMYLAKQSGRNRVECWSGGFEI